MIKVYPAIFEKDTVGFGIYFPDVEGAETQADTIEEGLEIASDALGIQLAWHIEKQMPLPNVSSIDDIVVNNKTALVRDIQVNLRYYLRDSTLGKYYVN